MSIQSEIDRINNNVAAAYSALSDLGATMPAEQNSDNLAATALSLGTKAQIDLLWENTNYESGTIFKTFATQTLSLGTGLSAYDEIRIHYQQATSAKRLEILYIPKSLSGIVVEKTVAWWDSSATSVGIRAATVNFSAGTILFSDGTKNATKNNYCMIPYRIYGIKGVNT